MSWFCWFETIFWDVVTCCISTSLFLASCLSKGAGCALSNSVAVDAESSSLHGIVDVTPSHSLRCCISFSTARASTALPPQSYLVESSHSSPVPASHKKAFLLASQRYPALPMHSSHSLQPVLHAGQLVVLERSSRFILACVHLLGFQERVPTARKAIRTTRCICYTVLCCMVVAILVAYVDPYSGVQLLLISSTQLMVGTKQNAGFEF